MENQISVIYTGVVSVGYDNITVNSNNLLSDLLKGIEEVHPATNYNGDFAGRITITVEFLGDIEGPQETTPCGGEGG